MGNAKTGWFGGRLYDSGIYGITGYLGQPGTGKSYRMLMAIQNCLRVVIFNSVGGYGGRAGCNPRGFVSISDLGTFAKYLGKHRFGKFRILYTPKSGDVEAEFLAVARLVVEAKNTVFGVEEIWLFQKPNWSPGPLKAMMLTGRHHGISLYWTAQRSAEVHRTLTGVSNQLFVGRLEDAVDVAALRGRLPPEFLAKLPTLPNRTFIHKTDGGGCVIVR
jgi:hypothetical protein